MQLRRGERALPHTAPRLQPEHQSVFLVRQHVTAGTGNDVISQIRTKYPQIDMSYWGAPQFSGVQGGIATFQLRPTQNAMGWGCYFDVAKPAGQQLVYCGDSWSHYPLRWAGMHGGYGGKTPDGWIAYALMGTLQSANQAGVGRYTMQVNQIYNNGGLKSISSSFTNPSTCEVLGVTDSRWLTLGATGMNCIKVNVNTEPMNTNPSHQICRPARLRGRGRQRGRTIQTAAAAMEQR